MDDPTRTLSVGFLQEADRALAATDRLLETLGAPGPGLPQPVHTCYLPADLADETTAASWGEQALIAAEQAGGLAALAGVAGVDPSLHEEVVPRVEQRLRTEPVEDLRLDLEDGYGLRPDQEEDDDAVRAARTIAASAAARHRGEPAHPRLAGIRFKCLEADTRARGLRTLDLFVTTLVREGGLARAGVAADGLPPGLTLTLPKVSTVDQVEVMVAACAELEQTLDLAPGRLTFEIQVETPWVVLGPDGTCPVPSMLRAGGGRVTALHYGTYDYSASLGVAAHRQSLEHPVADHAKAVIQLAAAGTGVHLSDGSSNRLPVGDADQRREAWALHARLVTRSLDRAFYQGWDLHPHQLPTRYLATYAFYRDAFPAAADRLAAYRARSVPGIEAAAVADEPATARALAGLVHRAVACGAVDPDELTERTGLSADELHDLAHPAGSR